MRLLLVLLAALTGLMSAYSADTKTIIENGKKATALVVTDSGSNFWTAFCIDASSGLFVTTERAVSRAGNPRSVTLVINSGEANQKVATARVVRADKSLDLVLLKVEDAGALTSLDLGTTDNLVETMPLTAFGFAASRVRGDYTSVSVRSVPVISLVKTKGKLQQLMVDGNVPWAGGPLLDGTGKVVAIISLAQITTSAGASMPLGVLGLPGTTAAVPVNLLSEWLNTPDVAFEPTPVLREKATEPQEFFIKVTPWRKVVRELSVELVLGAGKEARTFKAQRTEGDNFKVNAPILAADDGVRRVPLTVRFEDGAVTCSAKDLTFKVDGQEVKLSELRKLESAEPPDERATISLINGDRLRGVVLGLKTIEVELAGGVTAQVDLRKALSITGESPSGGKINAVDYRVVVKQDGRNVQEIAGAIKILDGRDDGRRGAPELVFCDSTAQGIVPHDDVFNPGRGDFSVVIFFKSSKPPTDHSLLLAKARIGITEQSNWAIDLGSYDSRLDVRNYEEQPVGSRAFRHGSDPFDNRWHSQAIVREAGIVRCYFDGREIGKYEANVNVSNLESLVFSDSRVPFIGSLKNVSYWSRALAPREIANLADETTELRGNERGLVAYWPMDEGRGDTFRDIAGGRHGKLRGNFRCQSPTISSEPALRFNDRTTYGVVPHDDVFNPGRGDFSVVTFFKSSSVPSDNITTMTKSTSDSPPANWSMHIYRREAYYQVSTQGMRFPIRDPFDGQWHSQMMVREDGLVRCYFDGEEVGSFQAPGNAWDKVDMFFGHLTLTQNHDATMIGEMKNCSYWSRALTPREVSDIASGKRGLTGKERGLVAYWPMNDGRGSVFKDVVGGYHGTLKGNFSWYP